MKHLRFVAAALTAAALMTSAVSASERIGLKNFAGNREYLDQFTDIQQSDWFYANVASAFRIGLMNGTDGETFNPNGEIKLSEAIAVAARLHSIYYTGSDEFEQSDPWYETYADYAKENGIIETEPEDYAKSATRAQFAELVAAALPDEAFEAINDVVDGGIPDVPADEDCAPAIYKLYRAGIVVGNDALGTFEPESSVKRCEIAAILSRVVNKANRLKFTSDFVYEREYNSDREFVALHASKYDKKGNLIERIDYDTDGIVTERIEYEYDKNGKVVREYACSGDGEFIHLFTYSYHDDGTLSTKEEYNRHGELQYKTLFSYNTETFKDMECYSDIASVGWKVHRNDENSEIILFDKDGNVLYTMKATSDRPHYQLFDTSINTNLIPIH